MTKILNKELEKYIKEEISYRDLNSECCERCLFFQEKPDLMLDREYIQLCNVVSSLGPFRVSKSGLCIKFTDAS